ncbi:MAG: alpha/beta fold hydrolase [Pseudomonadota bacterium]
MIHDIRRGSGRNLLLIHGLGATLRSWDPILAPLAAKRSVIAIDLPGHGQSPAERDSGTFAGLADSVERYIQDQGLGRIDVVGSSLGARIALELARRGTAESVVALDPGGFWEGWERPFFKATISASVGLLKALRPALPSICSTAVGRTALLAQLSARPWALDGAMVSDELRHFATTPTVPSLIRDLADGPGQKGPAADGSGPVVIGWGRHDRLCFPQQAGRACAAFPSARMHWFEHSGHFPMWDEPEEALKVIFETTGG